MSPGVLRDSDIGSSSSSDAGVSGTSTPVYDGAEPIAIVGMGCRFPGDSDTPAQFWDMLMDKRSGYSKPPLSRFNIDAFHSKKARPGSLKPQGGYFISGDTFSFDPAFFGITQTEAIVMDPQQRKLLECVYEAFESGGIPLEKVSGTNTACYVGNFTWDYGVMTLRDPEYPKPYSMTGQGVTILSNRISYVYNLCGPSFTIDTACSSSMYATHMACRALASGEVDGAVVGGTNLIMAVEVHMGTDKMGVLSPTSTCHTFDASAAGYGRGEGIGALYLKRLSDAVRDGDPIRAVIRGTAANANGKTSGITQPSAVGQEAVIRQAYKFAGNLDPALTSYFECHGTGTAVGDPTETKAISNVFLDDKSTREALLIGAVKTNVGHAEAASALASIMKVVMALETGKIPATIGIKKFNPKIDFKGGRLQVAMDTTEWPEGYEVRRASVNSFGYGGANGHAIIDSAQSMLPGYESFKTKQTSRLVEFEDEPSGTMGTGRVQLSTKERTQFLLPFSAHDAPTLKNKIANVREVAESYDLEDLAFTLSTRRSYFFNRGFTIADRETVTDDLDEAEMTLGKRGSGAKIAFIFTGQGAQAAQMGKELMQDFPSYLRTIRQLDEVLQTLGPDAPGWTIENELLEPKSSSSIDQVHLSQPLCTAVQVALVDLLRLWGINPAACIGHSSGEIGAAYAAGFITSTQAILFAYFRGVAVGGLTTKGTMLAVGIGAEAVEPYLEPGVRIACYNSPESVTLSGDEEAASKVKAKLEADKLFVRALKTSGRAYHSHHMQEVGEGYMTKTQKAVRAFASKEQTRAATESPLFVSSVTGVPVEADFIPGPEYWKQNLESPVRFTQALEHALEHTDVDINCLVEIGPHSALAGPIRQLRDKLGRSSRELDYIASLMRGESATTRLLDLAGSLFMKGYSIDFEQVNVIERVVDGKIQRVNGKTLIDLPRYCWNYTNGKDLRSEHRLNTELRLRKFPRHDLLGSKLPGTIRDQAQWRNMLDIADVPWLEQHSLGPQPVLPAVGYLAIAVEAARQFYSEKLELKDSFRYFFPQVTVKSALTLPPAGTPIEVMTSMRFQSISDSISSKTWLNFTIQSHVMDVWSEHCVGTIGIKDLGEGVTPLFEEQKLQEPKTSHTWYRGFKNIGLNYGPPFNGLIDIRVDPWGDDCTAKTHLLPTDVAEGDEPYLVHPGAMDTCMQAILIGAHHGSLKDLNQSFIPVNMEEVSIWSYNGEIIPPLEAADGRILATGTKSSLRALWGTVQLFSPEGKPLFAAKKVNSITYAESLNGNQATDRHPYLRVLWKPDVDYISDKSIPSDLTTRASTESELLELWARNLSAVAKSQPAESRSVLASTIAAWFPEQAESVQGLASFDMSQYSGSKEIFRLESVYVSMVKTLTNDSSPVDPSAKAVPSPSLNRAADLLCHKYPGMDIMNLCDAGADLNTTMDNTLAATASLLGNTLAAASSLKRFKTFTCVSGDEKYLETLTEAFADFRQVNFENADLLSASAEAKALEEQTFDLIVVSDASRLTEPVAKFVSRIRKYLRPNGRILVHNPLKATGGYGLLLDTIAKELSSTKPVDDELLQSWSAGFTEQNLSTHIKESAPSGWTIVTEPLEAPKPQDVDLVLLSRRAQDANAQTFAQSLNHAGRNVTHAAISDASFAPKASATYISIIEFGENLFDSLTETEFKNIQALAVDAKAVFWLTTGNLLGETNAHAATIMGLSRCLQTEYPQLDFFTIDLDHTKASLGAEQVSRMLDTYTKSDVDKEYIIKNDVVHVSRLSEDKALDKKYEQKISKEVVEEGYDPSKPVRLAIGKIALLDTLHFVEDTRDSTLKADQVEVEVKSVGLNMKEFATFRGTFNSESLSHEGSGVVRRTAPGVTNVQVGDRVCWMGKGAFGNIERFASMHLHKIDDNDSYEAMASIPLAFSTAVYGLLHLGRLKKGEKVLIHSATGGVGLAALQIAQMVGAEIYATVGTNDKREYLKTHYKLDDKHIFNSRDPGFAAEILKSTDGYGIDVCLNSLVREMLKASWSTMASNGRHIEIGRTDILDFGTLNLNVFKRNTTFSAFDFGVVADEHPEIPAKVMTEVMQYYREGKITPLAPLYTYPASDVSTAFEQFADEKRIGKVAVNFPGADGNKSSASSLKVLRSYDAATFKADGTYLLVGCLGGLGRCMARWMVEKGARNLTFIGRSGADNKEAATFVDNLRASGVTIHVVRGDVGVKADVERAVKAAGVPVLGAVQGAMALEDKLFSSLDLPGWNYAVKPKIQGTLNLHECLEGQPLDFFVMISSISAMTGAPTQSNYCAGNTFLDFFARYRKQQGLPATTIGLSMVLEVGFVSQNLGIEQGIARSGIHGINEADFINLMETAMLPAPEGAWAGDHDANKFLVSGLEPAKLAKDIDVNAFRFWKQPRVGPLLTAIEENTSAGAGGKKSKGKMTAADVMEAVVDKFAKTFMIPVDDVDVLKPLVAYGMDSMMGIALRNWVFSSFGVDVPTSDFMGPALTAKTLTDKIFAVVGA